MSQDRRATKAPYLIRLVCGCLIRSRMHPITEHVKYGCTSGLGHGYALSWTKWDFEGSDVTRTNRQFEAREGQ